MTEQHVDMPDDDTDTPLAATDEVTPEPDPEAEAGDQATDVGGTDAPEET